MSRLLTFLIAAAATWLLLTACSPTKQAARQDGNLQALKDQFDAEKQAIEAKAVADYVAANPCIYPEINLDSIIAANTGQPNDFLPPHSDTVRVKDTLVITRQLPGRVTRILVPTPDNRALQLAQDSIHGLQIRLASCQGQQQGSKDAVKVIPVDHWKLNYWFWVALGLFLCWVVFIVWKIVK